MSAPDLPQPIDELVALLQALPGACAVTLGGSRATGTHDPHSDWDLGLYYRGTLDTTKLTALGTVHRPGSWGRIMNGGAWLTIAGHKVDVLLRDLDVVEHWSTRAERGEYEVDALLGYAAGCPTYSLMAERAVGHTLRGPVSPSVEFPEALAHRAPGRWRYHRDFSLMHARMRAQRTDLIGTLAQTTKAVLEECHARMCERRRWCLNEKRLLEAAGLTELGAAFVRMPSAAPDLLAWLERLEAALKS